MQVRYQAALRPEGFEVYPSLPKKARAFLQIPYLRDSPAFLQAFSALLLTKLRSDAGVESVGGLVADHRTLSSMTVSPVQGFRAGLGAL